MYACLVSKTSISEGASVSAPLSAIETPLASPFSISARVFTRQKIGPPAETETIQREIRKKEKIIRKDLRMRLRIIFSLLLISSPLSPRGHRRRWKGKQKEQRGHKRQKRSFAFIVLFALLASPPPYKEVNAQKNDVPSD